MRRKANKLAAVVCTAIACLASATLMAFDFNGKKVLWLGTSIPGGCTYPYKACENLGMTCINKALGASFLCMKPIATPFYQHTGYSLTMTSEEKEDICRPYIESGELSDEMLADWKYASYNTRIMDDIRIADVIVVDHGYNDGDILDRETMQDYSEIDWTSRDRKTFIGAFNYMYDIIKSENPNAIVLIGGYFQDKCTMSYTIRGSLVAKVSKWISDHYGIPLLDVWNYTDIPDGYMPNSADYLDKLNEIYGTDFKKIFADSEGNITYFQKFCPDGVHPFTDPTGGSDRQLDDIFSKLLYERLSATADGIEQTAEYGHANDSTPLEFYSITGVKTTANNKGVKIMKNRYGCFKYMK